MKGRDVPVSELLFCCIILGGIVFTLSHIIYVPPLEGQEWIAALAWGMGIPSGIALSALLVLLVSGE